MKVLLSIFAIGVLALCVNAAPDCATFPDGSLLENENDCERFFICVAKIPESRKCPFGLHFSRTKKVCLKPLEANCAKPAVDCKSVADGDTIAYPGDCSKFYVCMTGVPNEKKCKDGLHYNAVKKYCEDPASAGCGTGPPPTKPPPTKPPPAGDCKGVADGDTIAHEDDCSKFYVCMAGVPNEKNCKAGLHYNAVKKYCQDPASAGCGTPTPPTKPPPTPPTAPTPPTPPTAPTPPTPPTAPTPPTPSTAPTPPTPPTKPPPTPPTKPPPSGNPFYPNICKGQPLGKHMPYCYDAACTTGDCTKFVTCIGGGVGKDCAPPTHFKPSIQGCDWPESAKCTWPY